MGKWCTPEGTGCRLQEDAPSRNSGTTHERHLQAEHDLPCNSGMTQERHLLTEHDPMCKSDAVQEAQVSKQSRSTASRTGTAEESDKKPFYKRNSENDPLRDCRQEDREANSRFFCRIATGQGLDLVEGSIPSKTEK
jgi:hypothetical protein